MRISLDTTMERGEKGVGWYWKIEKLKEKESEGIGIFFISIRVSIKAFLGEWKILLIFLEDCCSMTVWGRFLEISLWVLEII